MANASGAGYDSPNDGACGLRARDEARIPAERAEQEPQSATSKSRANPETEEGAAVDLPIWRKQLAVALMVVALALFVTDRVATGSLLVAASALAVTLAAFTVVFYANIHWGLLRLVCMAPSGATVLFFLLLNLVVELVAESDRSLLLSLSFAVIQSSSLAVDAMKSRSLRFKV